MWVQDFTTHRAVGISVTPTIERVASKHLDFSLSVVGTDSHESTTRVATGANQQVGVHNEDPKDIVWKESLDYAGYYSRVQMDGETYVVQLILFYILHMY